MMRIRKTRGFTLLEVAITLGVIVLLLGSLIVPLAAQVEQRQVSATEQTLEEVRNALIGHAITYGYLPCPDTDNDGAENVTAGACTTISSNVAHGRLPWQTLGLTGSSDAWGNRFSYAVFAQYARRAPNATFTLATTGANLTVRPASAASTSLTLTAVAVIISHGRNGFGAVSAANNATYAAPSGSDEQENTDDDVTFVSRIRTDSSAAGGEFDDIVTWIPLPTLFNRMVAAGRLP